MLGEVLRRLEISPNLVKVAGQLVLALEALDCLREMSTNRVRRFVLLRLMLPMVTFERMFFQQFGLALVASNLAKEKSACSACEAGS